MKKIYFYLSVFFVCTLALICGNTLEVRAAEGAWQHNDSGWWWTYPDGSFPTNKWEKINGQWYRFNSAGYAMTGWYQENEEWYYFDQTNCNAYEGWHDINGITYYFYPGQCYAAKGWQKIDAKWCYFKLTGAEVGKYVSNRRFNGIDYEAGTLKGIDVSVYQNNIDWNSVRNEGISYAMVRIGNNRKLDSSFARNMREANAAGIYTGVYFYSKATSEIQSLGDAQWVISQLKGYNVNYPIAIDLEDVSQTALGREEITRIAKAFCDEVRAAGYTPMVYCNENWARNYLDFNALHGVGKWIARYNYYYDVNYARDIWQSGSTCRINGIGSKFVDIDFARTNYAVIGNRVSAQPGYTPSKGVWKLDGVGYWFAYINGGYPKEQWELINGRWFYFNHSGYIVKGWQFIGGAWFYFEETGAMKTGWLSYYGTWFYLKSSGAMATGWVNDGSHWYYMNSSGGMMTGWINDGGVWYYLANNGAMATGWVNDRGTWYYMNGNGSMYTGWLLYGGKWYYLYSNGAMARNAWVGKYWVDANGVWS